MGYVGKHWRGEHSLGTAFWINNVVVGILYYLIAHFVFVPAIEEMYGAGNKIATFWAFVALIVVGLTLTIWMAVGLWASAIVYKQHAAQLDRSGIWGTAAQIIAVLTALWALVYANRLIDLLWDI